MSLCGAFVPQDEAKAGVVTHRIIHGYGHERGETAIASTHRTFWTDYMGNQTVGMGWIRTGYTRGVVIMQCGGYHIRSVWVDQRPRVFYYYPPHRW